MRIIGLTGGMGTGKSTVAKFLTELGAVVIDLDKVGHEVLKAGDQAYNKVVNAFGNTIISPDGEIDRAVLGEMVFNDHMALLRLNSIVHPAIDKVIADRIEECRLKGVKVVILEAAVMIDAGKTGQVEELWVTTASEKKVLERLRERSGYSENEAKARINAQLSEKERAKYAYVIIDTDCTLDELKKRVTLEWQKLLTRL